MAEHAGAVHIAAAQWEHRMLADFEEFASGVTAMLDRAADAQIVVFPEQFTVNLLTTIPGWERLTPPEFGIVGQFTDDYVALFREEARKRDQVILAGSHLVGTTEANRNRAFLFTPDGGVTTHDKTHLFPVETDSNTSEGDEFTVVDLGFVTVGIAICYEAEVPEVATILARRGAEIILCPSYTITPAGFWRVRHCAQARCIENQVYWVHCSTVGHLGAPIPDGFGKASILGPCDVLFPANGVFAEAAQDRGDVISATLDLALLHDNRRSGAATIFHDRYRRAALYREHVDELLPLPLEPGAGGAAAR
jgi:predicted amidohydrolase